VSIAVTDVPAGVADGLCYFHEGGVFEVGRSGGDPLIACADGRLARFDRGFQWGAVTAPASCARAGLCPLARPLDDLVVIHRSFATGALAVRATASVRDGQALALLGDTGLHDAGRDATTWAGWLLLEPEMDSIRISPLPSTRISGAVSPARARLAGLHLVDSLAPGAAPAATLDAQTGAAEILRFAFAPLIEAVPPDRMVEMATLLAERMTLVRLSGAGRSRFGWRRGPSPLSLAPPAGA